MVIRPFVVEDAYEADISSAYPYAMTKLPQFIEGDYAKVSAFEPAAVGIYRVSGEDAGKYPLIFDHDFKPVRGEFKDLWVTSFEVERALKAKDVRLKVSEGWLWIPDASYTHNPMKEYVEHFYKKKQETPKSDPNYYFFKIMLNGLYGKFVQTTEIVRLEMLGDQDESDVAATRERIPSDYKWDDVLKKFIKTERTHRAGGLYNPFIATLITGFVRGYLYDLEKKYKAFHSATDAIKTTIRPKTVGGLGGLNIETFGRCYAFRNKLYLHFGKGTEFCEHKDPAKLAKVKIFDTDGQHLCKYGLHGFKGEASELFAARHRLLAGGSLDYEYDHMIGLREGFKRRETICSMVKRSETLKLV